MQSLHVRVLLGAQPSAESFEQAALAFAPLARWPDEVAGESLERTTACSASACSAARAIGC